MPAGFDQVSQEQALAYCEHVRVREPFRLQDLARRMAATGGPIGEMDASFVSLVPLWDWFVRYVLDGCPGISPDARPSLTYQSSDDTAETDAARKGRESNWRTKLAAEGLEHYLRLVWDRYEPPAEWNVYVPPRRDRYGDYRENYTGFASPSGGFRVVDNVLAAAWEIAEDRGHARRSETLLNLQLITGWDTRMDVPVQERRPSVLEPLLEVDLGEMPPVAAVSPVWSWPEDWWKPEPWTPGSQTSGGRVGEEMTLWRGRAEHLDEPARLEPLPADAVAIGLTGAGFVGADGDRVDAGELLGGEEVIELGHGAEAALAQVLVADGAVRAVHIEPLAPTREQWRDVTGALRALARRVRARFVADDRIDG